MNSKALLIPAAAFCLGVAACPLMPRTTGRRRRSGPPDLDLSSVAKDVQRLYELPSMKPPSWSAAAVRSLYFVAGPASAIPTACRDATLDTALQRGSTRREWSISGQGCTPGRKWLQ